MRWTTALISLMIIAGCGNNKAEQARQEQFEDDTKRLNISTFYQIVKNIDRELPTHLQFKDKFFGGYKDMTVFVDNNTIYKVDKLQMVFQFFKANGELGDEQTITFRDIMPGENKSQPLRNNDVGTTVRKVYSVLSITELKDGEEIINMMYVIDPNQPH